jgi:hypothetical protein
MDGKCEPMRACRGCVTAIKFSIAFWIPLVGIIFIL